jgi:hypothetical protein
MWKLDEFQPGDVEKVLTAVGRADIARKAQKRGQTNRGRRVVNPD